MPFTQQRNNNHTKNKTIWSERRNGKQKSSRKKEMVNKINLIVGIRYNNLTIKIKFFYDLIFANLFRMIIPHIPALNH